MNNPQTVDRFNSFARRISVINAKKTRRTDDDYLELRATWRWSRKPTSTPSTEFTSQRPWLAEAIASAAFKVAKISRADIRGAMFTATDKAKLAYRDSDKVQSITDVVKNEAFRIALTLAPRPGVRLVKAFPIFHKWSFAVDLEFDDKIIDPDSLTRIVEHTAKYGGFGDFRPKFGRAVAKVSHG